MATKKRKRKPTKARATKPKRKRSSKSTGAATPEVGAKAKKRAAGPSKPAAPSAKPKRPASTKGSGKSRAKVKPKAKTPKTPRPKAKLPVKPKSKAKAKPKAKPKKRKLSKTPEAIRARKRRADQKAIREQLAGEREEKKQRRIRQRFGDELELAEGWLERIRDDISTITPVSLSFTTSDVGASKKAPWLIVGRYDFQEPQGYADFAEALDVVRSDLILEAQIHPQRLSQIRVVYHDPKARKGESDAVISKIGAWEFIISDLIGEIIGTGADDDLNALAVRYEDTIVPTFYVYFSVQLVSYTTKGPWQEFKTR